MLVDADGGRFARRPDDHDPVGAGFNVEVDELAQRGKVQRAVVLHGRRDCDEASGQHVSS
jgi:hypothetical protein